MEHDGFATARRASNTVQDSFAATCDCAILWRGVNYQPPPQDFYPAGTFFLDRLHHEQDGRNLLEWPRGRANLEEGSV